MAAVLAQPVRLWYTGHDAGTTGTTRTHRRIIMIRYRLSAAALLVTLVLSLTGADMLMAGQTLPHPAEPFKVTLFPQSARIEVLQTLPAENSLTLFLPHQADPESLTLNISGNTVTAMEWVLTDGQAGPAAAAVKEQLLQARAALARTQGRKTAIEARIAMWSQPRPAVGGTAELERLDKAMTEHLSALLPEAEETDRLLEKQQAAVHELEARLNNATGGSEKVWAVTAQLHTPASGQVTAQYAYTATGCGWQPLYTLHAVPGKNVVEFSYAAALRQGLGTDWNNVRLAVATLPPRAGLAPPPLPRWNIGPVQQQTVQLRKAVMMAADAAPENMLAAAPEAAERSLASTYAVWNLGTVSLAAGGSRQVPVLNETWQAAYVYTVRPARSPRAFLTARVTMPETRLLPAGQATMLVDGATAGRQRLEFAGTEETFHFGSDPLVTAQMNLQKRQEGTQGFIGKKQVFEWAWEITLTNARQHPVNLEVQDAAPQLRLAGMELKLRSSPEAELDEKTQQYVWKLAVPAGSERVISHAVTVTAPEDTPVDAGRKQ